MPFGFADSEWTAGKSEVLSILRARAKLLGMITYSELSRQVQAIELPYDHPAMSAMLDEVSTDESNAGRGMLSVIVVHKHGDMEPGKGFYALAERLGHDVSDPVAFWIKELHRVHRYWSR